MKKHILKALSLAAIFTLSFTNTWAQDVTFSPPIAETGVSKSPVLRISFDKAISIGEGEIFIFVPEENGYLHYFSSKIKSGFPPVMKLNPILRLENGDRTLTIDLSETSLPFGKTIYVAIDSTVIKVGESNWDYLDPGDWSSLPQWCFTIESEPEPLTATLSPENGATNVPVNTTEFVLTFDEDIELVGADKYAKLFIKDEQYSHRSVELNPNMIDRNTLNLSFESNILSYETEYEITIPTDAIKARNSSKVFPGIDRNKWSFKVQAKPVPPVVVENGYLPASGAIEVPIKGSLTLTFNKDVEFGVNNELFLIYRDGGQPKSFVVSGEHVSISEDNRELIVDLSGFPLNYETEYFVVIEEGYVRSVSDGAPYEGIKAIENTPISGQVWHFKTESRPPFWQVGYPKISNMSPSGFTLEVHADIPGTVYGVITMSPIAPAPDSIAASKNHDGDLAIMSINEVVESTIDPTIVNVEFADNDDVFYLHVVYRRSISGELSKYGEVRTLVIDRRAPRVTDTYPTDGCLAFPVDGKIVVNFSERVVDLQGNALSTEDFALYMVGEEDLKESIPFTIDNTVISERTRITITPDEELTPLNSYELIIRKVKDLSGNTSESDSTTVSFETDGEFVWTGDGEDANWLNVNNWGGVLPGAGKSVLIPGNLENYPVIGEGEEVTVNNLTIEPGASLTHTGGTLNVTGKLLLQSDTDGNASYINTGGTINVVGDSVRVEQYFENPILTFLISSPTKGTTAANFGGYYPLYVYDNTSDTWPSIGFDQSMQPGKGYRMWTYDNLVYFSGQFNTEEVTVDLTRTNGKGYGWNLVGNPYPAGLDWSLLDVDENSKIEDSFWLWMPKDKKYGAYSVATDIPINIESSVIPSNHAFLVKVKLGEPQGSITFKPTAQVPSQGNYLKSAKVSSVPYVKFAGLAGAVKDEIAVAFVDDASFAYDKYDLEKRFANQQSVFELYTNAGSAQAAINAIPLNGTYTLPLGYNALKSGNFGVEMVSDYADNISCVLIDKELGVERLMRRGDKYEFTVNKAEKNISRFELKFTNIITSDKPIEQGQFEFDLFAKDHGIYISFSPMDFELNFEVIDINGRLLNAGELIDNHNVLLGVYDKGVYIVRITDKAGKVSKSSKVAVY